MSNQDISLTGKRILRLHPSAFLLVGQLLLLILYGVFDGLQSQRALISAFGVVILMLVVWVVNRSPTVNWIAWALAVPSFILSLLAAVFPGENLLAWAAVLEAALYVYGAISLIAYMMNDYEVTTDELFAAGATFTLIAWAFAYLYLACQVWVPGSFVSSLKPGQDMTFVELLFMSFTNLSATGLSDIVPATTWARVLAMLEQFFGVGYVAMVVSRLVGLTSQRLNRRRR